MEIEALKAVFNNKKVFITGHTGFKGTWLVSLLHTLGSSIKGYALPPENASDIFNAIGADALCDSVEADICDAKKLEEELLSFQPDFVFHLAAQPLVRYSYEAPLQTFLVNSQGSANLLNALRSLVKPCVCVMITTDKVYFNYESGRYYSEDDKLGGYDPYSASKACAELVIDSYRNSFFNIKDYSTHKKSISAARAGNVIGGGDWSKDRIIPDIIRALHNETPIVVRNPHAVRPWQHVLEPLLGYVTLAAHQVKDPIAYATAFNFGPDQQDVLPVSGLVERAIEHWGSGSYEKDKHAVSLHEAGLLHLDITKAKTLLHWKPKMTSAQAIQMTLDWYKTALNDKTQTGNFTRQQITNYLNH